MAQSLGDRLRTAFGLQRRGWSVPAPFVTPWGNYSSTAGIPISRDTAVMLAAVWACIHLLSSSVSRMPIESLIKEGPKTKAYTEPRWMRQPIVSDQNSTWLNHMSQVMLSLLTDGNSFTLIARDNSHDVQELHVLDPQKVELIGASSFKVRTDAGFIEYGTDDILHLPLMPLPGSRRGLSPLEAARQVIGNALAAQDYGTRFFNQSATPPSIIEVPVGSKVNIDELKAEWLKKHQGLENAFVPGVLTGGAHMVPTLITNEQAQFLQLRQLSTKEIAAIYGIPPHMIGDVERSTSWGTGLEYQGIGFVTYTLNDYLVLIENGYSRLVPNPLSFVRFNRNALMRGDAKSRADMYEKLWQIGVMSPDEIREKEDEPPLPGGIGMRYYVSTQWRQVLTDAEQKVKDAAAPPVMPVMPGGVPNADAKAPAKA